MDPKQTEGQNSGSPASQGGFSFSGGQPNPTPTAASGTPGVLSTGANISRTMNDLNSNDRKSATFNSPFAKHRFQKVAPQTGDILIDPSGTSAVSSVPSEKKGINRGRLIQFGLIFGGVALIGLVIFTVVMLINQPKTPSNNNDNTTQIVFNPESFYSYILNGNTDGKNIPAQRESGKTYALTSALTSNEDSEKKDYFDTASQALKKTNIDTLSELADGQLLLEDFNFLSTYVSSPLPTISELNNTYAISGEAGVMSEVANSYADYDKESSTARIFTGMADKYAKAFADSIERDGLNSISDEVTIALDNIEEYVLGIARITEDLCISINQEQNTTEAKNE